MVFSSIQFLWLFMPVVLVGYLVVPPRWRNALLAAVSLIFYAWGAHAFVFMFAGSVAFNFAAGAVIQRFKDAGRLDAGRRALWAAIVVNLALLFAWKYTVFAARQLDALLGGDALPVPEIVLPIGISFFTFHAISYIVDVWRGEARPMSRVVDFTQYMAFFPQLIAGPIVRYHQIDDQIRRPPARSERLADFAEGFPRFALGLCKKVIVADQVAAVADAAFGTSGAPNATTAWIGALAYTVQIYFDFSGYSDMAIGMARMFGFRFPENFARPYSAVSMTDFWRRWHMTLSQWFRDYVYIPLGGSRGTADATALNLMVVFFLTGAWHGAAWTFVLWGLYNGILLVIERLTGVSRMDDGRLAVPRRALTFLLVVLGWVLFRSNGLGEAADMYSGMASFDFGPVAPAVSAALGPQQGLALAVGLLTVAMPRDLVLGKVVMERWSGAPLALRFVVVGMVPYASILVAAGSFSPFLYFQF